MKSINFTTAELFALQEMIGESGYREIPDDVKKAVFVSVDRKVYDALSEDDGYGD